MIASKLLDAYHEFVHYFPFLHVSICTQTSPRGGGRWVIELRTLNRTKSQETSHDCKQTLMSLSQLYSSHYLNHIDIKFSLLTKPKEIENSNFPFFLNFFSKLFCSEPSTVAKIKQRSEKKMMWRFQDINMI